MSNQYPGFHTHVENGYPGEKGQKGVGGEKGRPGQEGRITEILFAFSNKTPADLFENTFPKDWDSEGHPKQALTVRPGQSFVYTVDNSIWTHLPQANTAGWLQTGTVNGDIYTVPGDKGGPGDKGQKGDAGYKGTPVTQVRKASRERQQRRATRAKKETKVSAEKKATKVAKVSKVSKALKANEVPKVSKVTQASTDWMVSMVVTEQMVLQETKVRRVMRASLRE